jgi:hypothetical protein
LINKVADECENRLEHTGFDTNPQGTTEMRIELSFVAIDEENDNVDDFAFRQMKARARHDCTVGIFCNSQAEPLFEFFEATDQLPSLLSIYPGENVPPLGDGNAPLALK